MNGMINVSEELVLLSEEMVKTIENEDKEYGFKKNKSYIERNVPAYKFKKNLVGLTISDFEKIISNQ